MPQRNKKSFGSMGEDIASHYLKCQHFEMLARNYRFGRIGEIDIIARENEFLCFIEVKTRKDTEFGTPAEAVNFRKQEKIKKLAYLYMNYHKIIDCNVRFDVVEILYDDKEKHTVNLIRNAF